MSSQILQARLSGQQRLVLAEVMRQWGCERFPDLVRAFLRIAAVAGPPSPEALDILHAMERLRLEAQDNIDEKITSFTRIGVPLRGSDLTKKLDHLLHDPATVSPPRPFACQGCRHLLTRVGGLSCAQGEDMLTGTPCPTTSRRVDHLGDGERWDSAPS